MAITPMKKESAGNPFGSGIEARKVRFNWNNTPIHWVDNDPYATHLLNVLHLLLPAGELWFCRIYNRALPLVSDAHLAADVRGFIRQEAVHSRSHDEVLRFLEQHHVSIRGYTARVEWLFERLLGDRPLGNLFWHRRLDKPWLKLRVGLIGAIEHFTTTMGDWVLNAKGLEGDNVDPVMLDLLRWHGAEEVEHRCVAHDLYAHLGGGYVRRQLLMAITFTALWVLWVQGIRHLMRNDPNIPKDYRWGWQDFRRLGREDKVPTLGMIVRSTLRYVPPGYHPRKEADTEQALAYFRRSPAAIAAAEAA